MWVLREAAVELGELVVIAERPAVEPDKTVSRYIVGVEQVEQVPLARNAAEVIELQPGRVFGWRDADSREPHRLGEPMAPMRSLWKLMASDCPMTTAWRENNTRRRSTVWRAAHCKKSRLSPVGMNAEYGNAQGGVISLVRPRRPKNAMAAWANTRLTLPGRKHWGANVYDSPLLEGKEPDASNPQSRCNVFKLRRGARAFCRGQYFRANQPATRVFF